MQNTVYQQALLITRDYLGPAAERFISRQIHFHLHKTPEMLTKEDIPEFAAWVKVSIEVLTDDNEMVDDFTERILKLTE
jgi:hypothetical protein